MSDDTPPGRPRSSGRPMIVDVAERAGVGAITVSRALRNPGSVSEARRRSIEKAVREPDYMPNRHASGLASARTDVVVCFGSVAKLHYQHFS